jgi:PAS domain S-box-containing protein
MVSRKKLSENTQLAEIYDTQNSRTEIPISITSEDTRRLLKDLQLRELELELKHEEVIKSKNELESKLRCYTGFFHHSSTAYFILNHKGIISEVNSAGSQLLNTETEQIINRNFSTFLSRKSIPLFEEFLFRNKSEDLIITLNNDLKTEYRIELFSNSLDQCNLAISPVDSNGREIQCGPAYNISEHEQLYTAIGESINYGIWVCDPDGRNLYASESFLKLVGIDQKQCSDFGWADVLHPDEKERTIEAWKECVSKGETWDIEHRYWGTDNKWHYILAKGVPVRNYNGEIIYWAGINLDIDKQKNTELELKKIEQNFKYAENISHMGSFQHNLQTDKCFWSDELYRICGFEPQSIVPDKDLFLSVFHPEDRPGVEDSLNNAIHTKTGYRNECRIVRSDREVRYVISVGEVICDENNFPFEIKGAFQDVTELKKIQISLCESEENYRMLFESMPVGLAITDTFGKIKYGNKKSRILLGVSRTALKKGSIDISKWKFVRKDGSEILPEELPHQKALRENRILVNFEIGILKENKSITWLNVTTAPIQKKSELLFAFIDITEQTERERQLELLSGKLKELNATKDKFFSIIAHDLKNPFNSILGFSELLLNNMSKYSLDEIERFIGIINSSSQNAYNLLENLLNWSRAQSGNIEFCPTYTDLTEIIHSNIEFVENYALKKTIRINFESKGKHMVEMSEAQM